MQTWVGQVVGGRYRLDRVLGAGGMGTVYAATQLDLGRHVAVKLLGEVQHGDPTLVRFEREARTAAALGHPHIVQVTDFQNVPGQVPFLVMELLDGRSLAEIVGTEGPLDAGRVARLAIQILSALSAAHAVGIVHRDIKPANIMVIASAAGELVKVVDFGIAKLLLPESGPPLTHSGVIIGTASYMAPEQAMGSQVDGRTDLYSVAACMFFALTRRKPIESTNMPAALMTEPPTPITSLRPDLDPALAAIVMLGLAKDPAIRFPDADAMATALRDWLARGERKAVTHSGVAAFAPAQLAVTEVQSLAPASRAQRGSCLIWLFVLAGLALVVIGIAALAGVIGYLNLTRRASTTADAGAAPAHDAGASPVAASASGDPVAKSSAGPSNTRAAGTAGVGTKATAKTGNKGGSCQGPGDCGANEQCDFKSKICICEKGSLILDCGTSCRRSTSPTDCGACGKRCPDDHMCLMLQGSTNCLPCGSQHSLGTLKRLSCGVHVCIDPNVDVKHCGACNHACAKGQSCLNGKCT